MYAEPNILFQLNFCERTHFHWSPILFLPCHSVCISVKIIGFYLAYIKYSSSSIFSGIFVRDQRCGWYCFVCAYLLYLVGIYWWPSALFVQFCVHAVWNRNSYRARVRHQGSQRTVVTSLFHFLFFSILDTISDSISFSKTPTHFLFPFSCAFNLEMQAKRDPITRFSRFEGDGAANRRRQGGQPRRSHRHARSCRAIHPRWGAVCRRRGGLPLPSSLPLRFDCIEAQYAGEEKWMCAEFVAPFVSPASWGSSPETRRQLRRGRRSIASPALRWIEGDRQWDGRGSHLSSSLLCVSELLGELILLLSTSTTATIVEPSIQVTASSCIAPSCLPPKTMASSSYVAPQHQHPICLTFWNCFCNYMSRVRIL